MSWTGQKRGYHHGNLREALVEAAIALIAESGPAGFTIAEAARRAGVSPAAPYRHFRDAEALLAEVALRGFERLSVSLAHAWRDGKPEPIQAFENIGRAYLGFARTEPAFYAAMFEARINAEAHPGLLTASEHAFAVLRNAAETGDGSGGGEAGTSAGPDGRLACLGDGPWDRVALRPAATLAGGNSPCRRRICSRRGCCFTCKASGWREEQIAVFA